MCGNCFFQWNIWFTVCFCPTVSESTGSTNDEQYLKWNGRYNENYNNSSRSIKIPETGFYFIYVKIALKCQIVDGVGNRTFYVQLHRKPQGYDKILTILEAMDSVVCSPHGYRSLFVGQLFSLTKGDQVNVWVEKGYSLIKKSSFGAYIT